MQWLLFFIPNPASALKHILTEKYSHLHSAQSCVLSVSFPVDLLLLYVVVNPLERKLAKRTSVQWGDSNLHRILFSFYSGFSSYLWNIINQKQKTNGESEKNFPDPNMLPFKANWIRVIHKWCHLFIFCLYNITFITLIQE